MNPIQNYLPQFVLHLQEDDWQCQCASCQQQDPFVIIEWQNQRRYSAGLHCETAAQAILLRDDAFILHSAEEGAQSDSQPNDRLQKINQQCINLVMNAAGDIALKLYAIGIFISQLAKMSADADADAQIAASGSEIDRLLTQGGLNAQFAMLPQIGKYKLQAIRTLTANTFTTALDAQAGMALALSLNEFKVLPDNYLQQSLTSLEQDARLGDFMQQQALWQNFMLYRCYHDIFPVNSADAFLGVCCDVWLRKILCAILIHHDVELTEARICALFVALERQPVTLSSDADGLLVGLSLLK